jgi:hypothetical protein
LSSTSARWRRPAPARDANLALFVGLLGAYVLCRRTLGSDGTDAQGTFKTLTVVTSIASVVSLPMSWQGRSSRRAAHGSQIRDEPLRD